MDVSAIAALGPGVLAGVLAAAFVTSVVHGATGIGGGFLMAILLAELIGVKPVVPVLAVALTMSGVARLFFNRDAISGRALALVAGTALPAVICGALVYGLLNATTVAILLGTTILASVPMRHWARRRQVVAGPRSLMGAGGVYGFISGASVGAGMLLIPFLLGYGLSRRYFVGTLAAIALAMNVTRTAVFGGTDMLGNGWLELGILCGLATLPGNWLGQRLLRGMGDGRHAVAIDVLTVFGGLNFFRIALTG
ncbi:sulfite exporter TauE/SafE family protein [Jannaschia sp. S6380]|uniref:sulfite exporter TauE/SafE family protein n=1 Tax=Jannaschia sp. S6380 TaxID=2926408 RepID=UPI001FF13A59|nr:sulfite exporter TauE/SafE family protein [Jannaschia sp. S6380]MCK0167222.1 sulfite exporter TauE/SafE family protein [Jannaschia sp. S6380]